MATEWVDSLPNAIRVGVHDCRIRKMERPWGEWRVVKSAKKGARKIGFRYAEYDPNNHEILVKRRAKTRAELVDSICHEIQHAIWNAYKIAANHGEERIVHLTAQGWVQVLFDNPQFARWIVDHLAVIHKRRRKMPR